MLIFKKVFKKMMMQWLIHYENKGFRYIYSLAEKGDRDSQFQLASIYETGNKTIEPDLILSYVLYFIAEKKGIKKAKNCLEHLMPKMTLTQWEEAQNIISQLHGSELTPKPSIFARLRDLIIKKKSL